MWHNGNDRACLELLSAGPGSPPDSGRDTCSGPKPHGPRRASDRRTLGLSNHPGQQHDVREPQYGTTTRGRIRSGRPGFSTSSPSTSSRAILPAASPTSPARPSKRFRVIRRATPLSCGPRVSRSSRPGGLSFPRRSACPTYCFGGGDGAERRPAAGLLLHDQGAGNAAQLAWTSSGRRMDQACRGVAPRPLLGAAAWLQPAPADPAKQQATFDEWVKQWTDKKYEIVRDDWTYTGPVVATAADSATGYYCQFLNGQAPLHHRREPAGRAGSNPTTGRAIAQRGRTTPATPSRSTPAPSSAVVIRGECR